MEHEIGLFTHQQPTDERIILSIEMRSATKKKHQHTHELNTHLHEDNVFLTISKIVKKKTKMIYDHLCALPTHFGEN